MDKERFGEIVGASVAGGAAPTAEQVVSILTDEELLAAANQRGLPIGEDAALSNLTPEQQERAQALQTAMAEKFSTKEAPLTAEDFSVVAVGEGEEQKTVVMLSTGNGLYKGSYDSVMSNERKNKQNYLVEVSGQEIDTRSAMTWEVYRAFIWQAKAEGIDPLPDSLKLASQNNEIRAATWLTGDPAAGAYADYGFPGLCEPLCEMYPRREDWDALRVRPAAVI